MEFNTAWEEHKDIVKAFLHKKVSNKNDVEDILQESLIKIYQNIHKVKDYKKLKSWIFQVVNNSISDFYRKNKEQLAFEENKIEIELNDEDSFNELLHCINPFIKELPSEEAKMITDIEIHGVSQKEYAKKNGLNYSTVKSRVKKSRNKIFKLYSSCCFLSINNKGQLVDYEKKKNCKKC